jgi:hypothetical protein
MENQVATARTAINDLNRSNLLRSPARDPSIPTLFHNDQPTIGYSIISVPSGQHRIGRVPEKPDACAKHHKADRKGNMRMFG